jgi:uncharacterized protein (TIGR02246 family)
MAADRTARSSRIVAAFVCFAVPALAGCRRDGEVRPPAADGGAASQAVRRADSVFAAAAAAHDLEGSVASLTADAVMFPPDQPPVSGRAAIREYMRQSFATPHFSVSWTTDTVVVAAGGDLAYSFARSRYTFPGRSGAAGAVDTAYGKGLNVWRRDADGQWRAVADIWNGAPVMAPIRPVAAPE